ncbi:alpha/beta hydrolase [Streptococcus mitis]|uniref:Alpha/beta hydrolase n=1 Tax=Streptococcus mitis TaxID=28037 RepID=A0A7X1RPU2_STRMT|nr:alpha/beta hydrolase-fold protein [Streptococcus mitis]MQQ53138.1 alpha/beta hydrolase [Streptococcus mitis]
MTLSRNKEFNWEGIRVRVSLPSNYEPQQAYPVVLLNDGELDYLSNLSQSVILVGLIPENRLDDFTPWQAVALKEGAPDFGGKVDQYHQKLFQGILKILKKDYLIDESRIAYGGYSLGGLAAVYSLYRSHLPATCIFSICGSFWYPEFIDFCREHTLMQSQSLIYLQNGQTEGANHSNRLSKAPLFARELHDLISEAVPSTYSTFDAYGHHEALDQRYQQFCDWLMKKWELK